MIAVIADDFTGAAELAGIALRYGLSVDVFTNDVVSTNADVLILTTDSRSLDKRAALAVTAKAVQQIVNFKPSLIYKKTDSVLRGYVVDELKVQMQIQGLKSALLIPANPSMQRTIVDGNYYINGTLIHETDFSNDPEFAIKSSSVINMLKAGNEDDIIILKSSEPLPKSGIAVGEVAFKTDIQQWATHLVESVAVAGAGDFFEVLLEQRFAKIDVQIAELKQPFLYVAGSAFANAIKRVQQWKESAKSIQPLNDHFELIETKAAHYVLAVKANMPSTTALELRTKMAALVHQLIVKLSIQELFIEGGSTAAAVLNALEISQLKATNELSRGVVRVNAKNLFITVKPGSYPLNDIINSRLT